MKHGTSIRYSDQFLCVDSCFADRFNYFSTTNIYQNFYEDFILGVFCLFLINTNTTTFCSINACLIQKSSLVVYQSIYTCHWFCIINTCLITKLPLFQFCPCRQYYNAICIIQCSPYLFSICYLIRRLINWHFVMGLHTKIEVQQIMILDWRETVVHNSTNGKISTWVVVYILNFNHLKGRPFYIW